MVAGQWLTLQDVADLLQVRIETVRRWVRQGELPVLELGGSRAVYRIRPDDLDRFVWQRYRSLGGEFGDGEDLSESINTLSKNEQGGGRSASRATGDSDDEPFPVRIDEFPAIVFREDASRPGTVLFVSREIEAMLGYPLSKWRDEPRFWLEQVYPADRAALEAELARTDACGEPFNMDYRMIAADGHTVWIHSEAALTPDSGEGTSVWEGVLIDITERKKVEAALGLRERQQQAVARLGQNALKGVDLSTLLDEAVVYVSRSLGVEYANVFEVLPGGESLVLRAGAGWRAGSASEAHEPIGEVGMMTVPANLDSQAGYTLRSHEPVIAHDLAAEERFDGPRMVITYGIQSGASVVIPGRGRPFGVLGAHSTRRRTFNREDVFFLQSVANVLASVVARSDTNWMTVTDVAETLQVTEETVRRWIRRSELPALNLGGPRAGYRVYPSDLERFIGDRLIRT